MLCAADDLPKKKPPALYKPTNPDGLAYLDFSVSTTGMLAGVQVSFTARPEGRLKDKSAAYSETFTLTMLTLCFSRCPIMPLELSVGR